MIYLSPIGGGPAIVVLETKNLEELKQGRPAKTPDGRILIAWTPDPVWLADRIADSKGDGVLIGRAIDEAAKRPQQGPRPYHKPFQIELKPDA